MTEIYNLIEMIYVRKIDGTWWPDINKGLLYLFNEKGIYKHMIQQLYISIKTFVYHWQLMY
jgi:hypothetical protein